jgi:hypothetical protein
MRLGYHHLLGFIGHKTAILANPEPKWDDSNEIAVALALVLVPKPCEHTVSAVRASEISSG